MTAGGLGALGLSATAAAASEGAPVEKAAKPLRLLILGGTGFIGPHMVRYALARGHEVTIFTRGRRDPDDILGDEVTALVGNRDANVDEGLSALEAGEWDAVIDNSGYVTRHVADSANLLKDRAGQYVFTSTLSVYASNDEVGADETKEVGTLTDEDGNVFTFETVTVEDVTGESYGPLKAYCEQAVQHAFGDRATIIRPGLIVGPGDGSDRWTYWPVRIDRGGEVMAPGDPSQPVEFIDARDLAEWTVRVCEDRVFGVYNAVGPATTLTMAEMLAGCRAATGSAVELTWVDWAFIQENEISPWGDMPAWIPKEMEGYAGFGTRSREKAISKGLTFRPLAVTAMDTLAWWKTLPDERRANMRAGINADREVELLAKWNAAQA
jgi:2'-hydroxyisoflavone reductase